MKRFFCPLPAARRTLLLALPAVLLTASACQPADEVPVPAQLLPPAKMVGLLVDLHTLEARTEGTTLVAPDSILALFRQQQTKIYWRHDVTDSAFSQSFRYYATHDQDLNDIYQTVVDSLAAREARLK